MKKFGIVKFLIPPNSVGIQNFMLLIIQDVGQLPSEKYKKHDLKNHLHLFQQYFSVLVHNCPT